MLRLRLYTRRGGGADMAGLCMGRLRGQQIAAGESMEYLVCGSKSMGSKPFDPVGPECEGIDYAMTVPR